MRQSGPCMLCSQGCRAARHVLQPHLLLAVCCRYDQLILLVEGAIKHGVKRIRLHLLSGRLLLLLFAVLPLKPALTAHLPGQEVRLCLSSCMGVLMLLHSPGLGKSSTILSVPPPYLNHTSLGGAHPVWVQMAGT